MQKRIWNMLFWFYEGLEITVLVPWKIQDSNFNNPAIIQPVSLQNPVVSTSITKLFTGCFKSWLSLILCSASKYWILLNSLNDDSLILLALKLASNDSCQGWLDLLLPVSLSLSFSTILGVIGCEIHALLKLPREASIIGSNKLGFGISFKSSS